MKSISYRWYTTLSNMILRRNRSNDNQDNKMQINHIVIKMRSRNPSLINSKLKSMPPHQIRQRLLSCRSYGYENPHPRGALPCFLQKAVRVGLLGLDGSNLAIKCYGGRIMGQAHQMGPVWRYNHKSNRNHWRYDWQGQLPTRSAWASANSTLVRPGPNHTRILSFTRRPPLVWVFRAEFLRGLSARQNSETLRLKT